VGQDFPSVPIALVRHALLLISGLLSGMPACSEERHDGVVLTFPASAVGAEGEVLRAQLGRFMQRHPGIRVVQQRTPDSADERHQLYVQWLNAGARDPDVLQLDVVWTPELAAAGWLLPLSRFAPALGDFFPAAIGANRHAGVLYALPWFVDVGMLYYRTDVLAQPPRSQAELTEQARGAARHGLDYGLVFQGARYEGLVTVFVEYLAAFGAQVLDRDGRAALDSPEARAALGAMRAAIREPGWVPRAVLSWQEEQTRFAFQNGKALFMRNWPYAYPLMQQADSRVRGRFAVTALPAAPGGRPAATLGGSQLAINAHSDQPRAAYALIEFLLQPEQLLERARVAGQFPPRPSLYALPALRAALPIDAARVQSIIADAVARPATPVYAELSDILQIHVHRCLSGQQDVASALRIANREIAALLRRVGLDTSATRPLTHQEATGG
jgi:multiple sugar transport system substrate-binding protein